MRRLISAALAAITLLGAGAVSVPVAAQPQPYNQYRSDPRPAARPMARSYRRDYRWDGRSRRGNGWMQHVRRCERAYRSYNRRTDTYRTRSGYTLRCRL